MPKQLTEDQTITHSILNLLNAGHQGMYAFANVLGQFGHPAFKEDLQKDIEKKLDRITAWIDDLYRGAELFSASWEIPKTFEASDAVKIANELASDTIYTANMLRAMISTNGRKPDPMDLVFMVSCYARATYSKENSIRGLAELSNFSENNQNEKQIDEGLIMVGEEVKRCHWMINQLSAADTIDMRFTGELLMASFATVPTLYTQAHDLNQLTARFRGGLTGENLGFTSEEAKVWEEARIPPVVAGYWRAFLFGPSEAIAWTAARLGSPLIAYQWRSASFTPQDAAEWTASGLHPQLAKHWKDAGFDPQIAGDFVRQGVTDPAKVRG